MEEVKETTTKDTTNEFAYSLSIKHLLELPAYVSVICMSTVTKAEYEIYTLCEEYSAIEARSAQRIKEARLLNAFKPKIFRRFGAHAAIVFYTYVGLSLYHWELLTLRADLTAEILDMYYRNNNHVQKVEVSRRLIVKFDFWFRITNERRKTLNLPPLDSAIISGMLKDRKPTIFDRISFVNNSALITYLDTTKLPGFKVLVAHKLRGDGTLTKAQLFPSDVCNFCDKLDCTHGCSVCKVARYCSAEHQRSDYENHKIRCSKDLADFLSAI